MNIATDLMVTRGIGETVKRPILKETDMKSIKQVADESTLAKIHNNTDKTLAEIESLLLVGIHVNNWMQRTIRLYADPVSSDFIYSVGRTKDGRMVVTSRDRLSECMNFRIAIDYWSHGMKVYMRD